MNAPKPARERLDHWPLRSTSSNPTPRERELRTAIRHVEDQLGAVIATLLDASKGRAPQADTASLIRVGEVTMREGRELEFKLGLASLSNEELELLEPLVRERKMPEHMRKLVRRWVADERAARLVDLRRREIDSLNLRVSGAPQKGGYRVRCPDGHERPVRADQYALLERLADVKDRTVELGQDRAARQRAERFVELLEELGAVATVERPGREWLVRSATTIILDLVTKTSDRAERAREAHRLNGQASREHRLSRARENGIAARETARRAR